MMASLVDCPTSPGSKGAELIEEIDCPVSDDEVPEKFPYDLGKDSDDDVPVDTVTTCPGQRFTKEEAKEIRRKWLKGYIDLCAKYADLCNELLSDEDEDENSSLPPGPLKVLPETTPLCIERGYCYHREFMTNVNDETAKNLGFYEPQDMLQVLSLRLSHTESCSISVYGMFAIRDDLEPLRNYVFIRTRDDPVVIEKDSFALPLCSPCRGMYVLDRALLEVDLWIKKEGDKSNDERLLSVYVEIDLGSFLDEKLIGRIHGDRCMLDMSYMFLAESLEATIQISALADNPSDVRFIAFSSCFDDEIILFKGKGVKKGELIRHIVAVKAEEKLCVRLELGNSVFEWTFQDEAGVSSSPDDLITNQFHVRVLFAPNNLAPITSRYHEWKRSCRE
ncbi:hypothetical protein EJB05_50697 [Eragrostis curvula]|uniref:DUF6598 domain-containing protein n=1 Tax=Eragrostis curvula TaxID=38414 RepID=A0A5J9SXL3_9POAL|nr:hypothetical protein EJB05_50697 [Eragrostis curvula]